MNNLQSNPRDRNVEQAIASLKRGSYLLKYGRRGKPKFCPFRLSNDETTLIWYVGKEEKQLQLSHISRIIPGQRTEVFQRYPRPEKEYQSFSLIYDRRSLDVICKDKDEAENWFVSLRALTSQGNWQKWKSGSKCGSTSSDSSISVTQRNSQKSSTSSSSSHTRVEDGGKYQKSVYPSSSPPHKRLGRALSDFLLDEPLDTSPQRDSVSNSSCSRSYGNFDEVNGRSSADTSGISFASSISSSSQGLYLEDSDSLCDVFIWGEGIGNGFLGSSIQKVGNLSASRINAYIGKGLKSSRVSNAKKIACGKSHVALITKQGAVYSWGEGSGGRLGHGVETDIHNPKLIESLCGLNIESVACGEYHTCALSLSGEFYTWGGGIHKFGLLGHQTEVAHWTPKKVEGPLEGLRVSFVSCGPWHSAVITSLGQLFTFGEGTFGALGHGDRESSSIPREVELLKGLRTVQVSCGFWHSAAIVEDTPSLANSGGSSGWKLFTWGSGDEGQLGHGDKESRLVPYCVTTLNESNLLQVACGQNLTVALTTSGLVYAMGSADYGKLGNPENNGNFPANVQGKIKNVFIEEISCGSHHVAVLSSKSEVYTWGRGENGQLGHGDLNNRDTPTLVEALKNKEVKSICCGRNFTAAICLHRQVSMADQSSCSRCHGPFNFRRKRHNCYNCGLAYCKACTSRKSLKASLAPTTSIPYRVCDECFTKLNKDNVGTNSLPPKGSNGTLQRISFEERDRVSLEAKPQGIISRLSSFDSFKRSDARKNQKLDYRCDRSCTSSSSPLSDFSERMSLSIPVSTRYSQEASPLSVRSSPTCSISVTSAFTDPANPEEPLDMSSRSTDALLKEISILKEQVDDLTRKSQSLEAILEKTTAQLKDASETAMEESEKNIAAKDVVKSLMMQLKELAAGGHQGTTLCRTPDQYAQNNNNSSSISSI